MEFVARITQLPWLTGVAARVRVYRERVIWTGFELETGTRESSGASGSILIDPDLSVTLTRGGRFYAALEVVWQGQPTEIYCRTATAIRLERLLTDLRSGKDPTLDGYVSPDTEQPWELPPPGITEMNDEYVVVLSATGSKDEASRLASMAVSTRLAGCVQTIPITSTYMWDDKVVNSDETLLLFKTTQSHSAALVEAIIAEHSYDTPEAIVLPITGGSRKYLDWLGQTIA
jgi:periplasmic divalent cation tolerance protein